MEHDSGSGVTTTINFQVASVNNESESVYFGQGDALFRMSDEDFSSDAFEGNIPVGTYLTLSDMNHQLLKKHELKSRNDYYTLAQKIAFLGVILADSPKSRTNTLTVAGSGKCELSINYWGQIKKRERLWFVLLPIQTDGKEPTHAQIVPYSCQTCPPPSFEFPGKKADSFDTMRSQVRAATTKEEHGEAACMLYSIYAGRCEDPGTVILSSTDDYLSLVPNDLLIKTDLHSHKSCLSSVHRFSMFIDGRPEL